MLVAESRLSTMSFAFSYRSFISFPKLKVVSVVDGHVRYGRSVSSENLRDLLLIVCPMGQGYADGVACFDLVGTPTVVWDNTDGGVVGLYC